MYIADSGCRPLAITITENDERNMAEESKIFMAKTRAGNASENIRARSYEGKYSATYLCQ